MKPADWRLSSITEYVVEAASLIQHPTDDRLFIEVRLGNDLDEQEKAYRDEHIYGAVYGQIRDVFASDPTAVSGNLPLPDIDKVQRRLQDWGVGAGTEIIAYGPSPALAARAWWVLRWAGLERVRILDGGLKEWVASGGATAQGVYQPKPRPVVQELTLTPGHMPCITVAEVEALDDRVLVIDARKEASYLEGYIPRALNVPAENLWAPSTRLRSVAEITRVYQEVQALGSTPVVAYCGGGVLSALTVLTLSALGKTPRLFVGSWSEWNKSSARMALSAHERKRMS